MLHRRSFLSLVPLAAFMPMMTVTPTETYEHTGLLECNTPEASVFDYCTVNGERIDHVIRANDVEGWVEYYPRRSDGRVRLRKRYRTGVVRFFFRAEDARDG